VKLCHLRIWNLGRSRSAAILHRASATVEICRKPFSRILTLFAQEENTTNFEVNGMGNVRGSMHNKVTVNGFPSILLVTRNDTQHKVILVKFEDLLRDDKVQF